MLGKGTKATERGGLTPWRRQRERPVRTRKEGDQLRSAHFLEMAEGGSCHKTKRKRLSEARLLSRGGRGWDLSRHGKKATKQGARTCWGRQRVGLVRKRKERDRAMNTHFLEMVEGGTCQDKERKKPSEEPSLPGDGRVRKFSELEKKATERGHPLAGDGRGSVLSGHGKKATE